MAGSCSSRDHGRVVQNVSEDETECITTIEMSTLMTWIQRYRVRNFLKKTRRRTGIIRVIPVCQFWSVIAKDSETAA